MLVKKQKLNLNFLIISIFCSILIFFFFNYNIKLGGGGLFLHLSNFLFGNNYLFFILLPLFLYFIFFIIELNKIENFLMISILLLLSPQYHLFHKYYDPLVFIIFLTLLDFKLKREMFLKYKFVSLSYLVFVFHYFVSFLNSYYIKF